MVILLLPIGRDKNGRNEFSGTEFNSIEEAHQFFKNVGWKHENRLMLISNGTVYGTEERDFAQAKSDFEPVR